MHRTSLGLSFVTVVCLLAAVAGGETIKINFQPQESVTPRGYLPDSGRVFGDRHNGYAYGWNRDISADARDRGSGNAPDQRYDTLVHFSKSGVPATWEIALSNGTYSVFLVCGDPSHADQANHIDIEGHVATDEDPQTFSAPDFDEFRVTVAVSDGRLTIKPAPQAANAKVMFVEITGGSSGGSSSGSSGGYSGGSGTVTAPYRIATAQDLIDLGNTPSDYDKHFDLVANIDMAGTTFSDAVIASGEDYYGDDADGTRFTGDFNGNGHVIRNLTITSLNSGGNYIGLFGYIYGQARIHHLGMENCTIRTDGAYIGAIVGRNQSGRIHDCYADCRITGDRSHVGGIVGESWYGSVINCYSHGRIEGDMSVGGIAGRIYADMRTCYSTAQMTGRFQVGGIVGDGMGGAISLSFWDVESSGTSVGFGGLGRTTSEMKRASTFIGWGDAWTIREGWDYPRLAWENAVGAPLSNIPARTYSGAGTEANPFRLSQPKDLLTLGARMSDWTGCFELVRDIDMSGVSGYLPIGRFEGAWNGNGHTIMDLTIDHGIETPFVGLIGHAYRGEVSNLRIVRPVIRGKYFCGALAGSCRETVLTDCSSEDGSVQADVFAGGLVGANDKGSVNACFNSSDVEASQYAGGLSGYAYGPVADCYNNAAVTATLDYAGAIVGWSQSDVTDCYNVGLIACPGVHVGGMIGKFQIGTMSNCFWDKQTSGVAAGYVTDPGAYGGPGIMVNSGGKTTAQMKTRATYVSAGWDFVGEMGNGTDDIWKMPSAYGYPLLAWQEESVSNATTDDFETGTFSVFDYSHAGEVLWSVDWSASASGKYSARSGDIEHDESSRLTLTRDCQAGRIRFMVKVSSEADFDILHFRIDGQEMDTWSGDRDWMEVSYPIPAGSHTFEWLYEKDGSQDEGEDAAWIDDVTFLTS